MLDVMIRFPKPRGFWDYALFALFVTGLLLLVFWSSSTYHIDWFDAAFALVIAIFLALGIVFGRRREKAEWIKHPSWRTSFIACFATCAFLLAAEYAHAYFLHRTTIATGQLRHDLIFIVVLSAALPWWLRRRSQAPSQMR